MRARLNPVLNQLETSYRRDVTAAAQGNAWVSRREQKVALPELAAAMQEVRGAGGKGARVHVEAVVSELMESARPVIAAVNVRGPSLLSKPEIRAVAGASQQLGERLIAIYEAITQRAFAGGVLYAPQLSGAEVAARIGALAPALLFNHRSESDAALVPVHVPAQLDELDEQAFVTVFGLPDADPGDTLAVFEPAAVALAHLVETHVEALPDQADEARALSQLLQRELTDLRFVILRQASQPSQYPAYLVGRAQDGSVVGFSSHVVWT